MAGERNQGQGGQGQGNGGGNPPPAGPRELVIDGTNEIVVEVVHWRNNPLMFSPIQMVLRARFVKSNLRGDEYVAIIEEIPDAIPGQRIRINIKERKAVIWDPLADEANREMTNRLVAVMRDRLRQNVAPKPPSYYEKMTDMEIKTWLYAMRQHVDERHFVDGNQQKAGGPNMIVVEGKLPAMEQIMLLPGKLRCNFFSNSSTMSRVREEPAKVET